MTRRDELDVFLAQDSAATVAKMLVGFSLDAVDDAARRGIALDYSEQSLEQVEAILGTFHAEAVKASKGWFKKGPTPEQLDQVAKMYGGYIGEVMRHAWGEGEWLIPDDGPFAHALTFKYGESLTCPPGKVYKRLTDGASDNILHYYQMLKRDREEPQA